jgi:hypothetical protein
VSAGFRGSALIKLNAARRYVHTPPYLAFLMPSEYLGEAPCSRVAVLGLGRVALGLIALDSALFLLIERLHLLIR